MTDGDTASRDMEEMAKRIRRLERTNSTLVRANRDLAKAIASAPKEEQPKPKVSIRMGLFQTSAPDDEAEEGNVAASLSTSTEEVLDAEGNECGLILKGKMGGPGIDPQMLEIFKTQMRSCPNCVAVLSTDRLPDGTEEYSLNDGIRFVTNRNLDALIRRIRVDLVRKNGCQKEAEHRDGDQ